jgi:hypothetical protein
LIRATKGAHTVLLDLERLDDQTLMDISQKYEEIARKARIRIHEGKSDTDLPNVDLN